MSSWEHAASTAERVITTAPACLRAYTFWKRPSIKGGAWKTMAARDADQAFCIRIPAVPGARSEHARKGEGSCIVVSAPSSRVIGSELFRATAESTTATYWPIWRH